MLKDAENEFEACARALLSACPDEFAEARIEAEVEDDWSKKTYSYRQGDVWKTVSVDPSLEFDADDALLDLRNSMRQDGRPAWQFCTFTLQPDGTFSFNVVYPDGGRHD